MSEVNIVPNLRSFEIERAERLDSRFNDNGRIEKKFLEIIEENFNDTEISHIKKGLSYAKNLDYHHVGLSSSEYLIHPIRVATLAIMLVKPITVDIVLIALLHNVFELTNLNTEEIVEKFGKNVGSCIKTLTVDRKRTDEDYKTMFYQQISSLKDAAIIKVLDKLDNLFVLGLNSSEDIRKNYINEIRKNLIPLAEAHLPIVKDYIWNLSLDCERTGFLK